MEQLNNKVTGATLTADEWNQVPEELQNIITQTGQGLSDLDLNQVGKGVAQYSVNGDFYTDSGAANAYVLTSIGSKQAPIAYNDGHEIRFLPANTNTAASTVNVSTLGVVNLVNFDGTALIGGEIRAGQPIRAFYDNANSRFQLLPELNLNNYIDLKNGRKNFIRNGDIKVNQRGLATYNAGGYGIDGWEFNLLGSDLSMTWAPLPAADTRWPSNTNRSLLLQKTTAFSGSVSMLRHRIAFPRQFSRQTITLSFYVDPNAVTGLCEVDMLAFINGAIVWISPTAIDIAAQLNQDVSRVALTVTTPNYASALTETINDYFEIRFRADATTSFTAINMTDFQLEFGDRATDFEVIPEAEQASWNSHFLKPVSINFAGDVTTSANYTREVSFERMYKIPTATIINESASLFPSSVGPSVLTDSYIRENRVANATNTGGRWTTQYLLSTEL